MVASAAVAGVSMTAHQRNILAGVNAGASSLSFVGSGFIVLCYLLFKELRKFSFKLVFYLALSDMLCSFFSIVGDPSKGFFCSAQGYSTHFFCVASFLWTTTIAFTLHRTVVKHKTDVEEFEAMFHLYVWGTSLAMTAIHLLTFYMPLWGAILYNGFTYFQVIRMLNNATRMAVGMSGQPYASDARDNMRALNRWGYYPLILIGSWAFGTINRIHDFFEPNHKIFWLSFLDVGMASLMGLFNSIAYGLNSSVRRAICERVDKYWPEGLKRWLPINFKYKALTQESELTKLDWKTIEGIAEGVPSCSLAYDSVLNLSLVDLSVSSGLFESKSAARRLLKQGGLYLNNNRVNSENKRIEEADIVDGKVLLLSAGKKNKMAVGMSGQPYASDARDNMRALNRWGYYPLILIGSWAFGTINRIHDFFEPNHKIFWLSFLDVGMASLMGLFNSIAYGLNSSVRRAICERVDKYWPEGLKRWLPINFKYKALTQESELFTFTL
ncbi:hypothetical protein Ahy_A06g030638 isoform C [Arachis hypogaea]|uniref:G-protein coupled receptors family 2 profile 2 domain-containing protein n=1 Tax=Arachis hypogaea TaxID=3818 RepID=A0A445CWY5_ARAHY|nr:hypothetical protein Ahy_A06g030638 isoform C [Arachis hypogaea]